MNEKKWPASFNWPGMGGGVRIGPEQMRRKKTINESMTGSFYLNNFWVYNQFSVDFLKHLEEGKRKTKKTIYWAQKYLLKILF